MLAVKRALLQDYLLPSLETASLLHFNAMFFDEGIKVKNLV